MSRMLFCLMLVLAWPAHAETQRYRVDLIVFIDLRTPSEPADAARMPPPDSALSIDDTAALAASGITVLADTAFGLDTEWARLRNSRNLRPLARLAWIQQAPPADRGPRLRLRQGEPMSVTVADTLLPVSLSALEGSVALRRSRFLHLDVDLHFTEEQVDGWRQYQLRDTRRMRRDELHYLDSPKLGVLARVTQVDERTTDTP